MIENLDPGWTIGGGTAFFTGLIFWLQRLVRSVRREGVDLVKDRTEIGLFERLSNENIALREQNTELLKRAQIERERADLFARERNEAQNELGALRTEVSFLRLQVDLMSDQLRGINNASQPRDPTP